MKSKIKRRNFLKTTSAMSIGMALSPGFVHGQSLLHTRSNVSIGVIGVGSRGRSLLNLISRNKDVNVPAICDINVDAISEAQKILQNNGKGKAKAYMENENSYLQLLERTDIDGVIIVTPWEWHVRMAVDSMKANKYVGLEVPAATTLAGCWDLINVHEETGTNLMFLENCCYDRETMAVLQMLRENLFGTPLHATCGYRHSGYGSKAWLEYRADDKNDPNWRMKYSLKRNADYYPTHGIGPVANWFNIDRGNRFSYLTSVATRSEAMHQFIVNHPEGGPNHPNAKLNWKQGDLVTTMVKTINGETIIINFDTKLPRPYSRDYSLHGTKGLWSGSYKEKSIYIDGQSPQHDEWENGKAYDAYMEKYDHPLWKNGAEDAKTGGHGGIDYFMIQDFIKCVRQNLIPPIDVYDAATWSSIFPLSEESIAGGSQPVFFPDFTRGQWIIREPSFGL